MFKRPKNRETSHFQ